MFKIANMTFNTSVRFQDQYGSAFFPLELTNKQLKSIQDAKQIETLSNDGTDTVIGQYKLAGWTKMEKMWDGYSITWQIASNDELEELRAKTEELETKLEVQGKEFAELIARYQRQLEDVMEQLNKEELDGVESEIPIEAVPEPSEEPQEVDDKSPQEEWKQTLDELQERTEEK